MDGWNGGEDGGDGRSGSLLQKRMVVVEDGGYGI